MTVSPAYNSVLYVTGTATSMTDEACTEDGANVQVTSTSKRVIDPATARTWESDPTETSRTPVSENLLFGKAVLGDTYTNVTVTGKYLPLLELVWCCAYDISIKTATDDKTIFSSTADYELPSSQVLSASGKLDCYDYGQIDYDSGGGTVKLASLITAGTQFVLSITLGASGVDFRAFVQLTERSATSSPSKNVKGSYNWSLATQAATTTTWTSCAFSDQ